MMHEVRFEEEIPVDGGDDGTLGALLTQGMEDGVGDSLGAVMGLEEEGAAELVEVEGHEGFHQGDGGAGVGAVFLGEVTSAGRGHVAAVDLAEGILGLGCIEPVMECDGAGGVDFVGVPG
ncbi:MAG: hypothetical protein RI897_2671 [Verrucomicrobiota bacterium]